MALSADGAFIRGLRALDTRAQFVARVARYAERLEENASFTVRSLSNYENGARISFENAVAIARALDCCYRDVLVVRSETIAQRLSDAGLAPTTVAGPLGTIERCEQSAVLSLLDEKRPVVLCGPCLAGKTWLATDLVPALWERFPRGVVWIEGRCGPMCSDVLVHEIERALDLGVPEGPDGRRAEGDWRWFPRRLWRRERCVVFDDVEDADQLAPFFAAAKAVPLLATTTKESTALEVSHRFGMRIVRLSSVPDTRIVDSLGRDPKIARRLGNCRPEELREMLEYVAGEPSRLSYVAAVLRQRKYGRLSTISRDLLHAPHLRDAVIRGLSETARDSLETLCFLGRDIDVPRRWAADLVGCSEDAFGDVMDALGYRLRARANGAVAVDPFAQASVVDALAPERRDQIARHVLGAVQRQSDAVDALPRARGHARLVSEWPIWEFVLGLVCAPQSAMTPAAARLWSEAAQAVVAALAPCIAGIEGPVVPHAFERALLDTLEPTEGPVVIGRLAMAYGRWKVRVLADFGAAERLFTRATTAFQEAGKWEEAREAHLEQAIALFVERRADDAALAVRQAMAGPSNAAEAPARTAVRLSIAAFACAESERGWSTALPMLDEARRVSGPLGARSAVSCVSRVNFQMGLQIAGEASQDGELRESLRQLSDLVPAGDPFRCYLLSTSIRARLELFGPTASEEQELVSLWRRMVAGGGRAEPVVVLRIGECAFYLNELNAERRGPVLHGSANTSAVWGADARVPALRCPLRFYVAPFMAAYSADFMDDAEEYVLRHGVLHARRPLRELETLRSCIH